MKDFSQCIFQYKMAVCELRKFESSDNYIKGFLIIKKEGKYKSAYLVTIDYINGKRVRHDKYIRKPDIPEIQRKLSYKKQNRDKYNKLLKSVKSSRARLLRLILKNKMSFDIFQKIEENWDEHELFIKKDKYKNSNSVSILGEKVRSRAECILAAIAFSFKIPYFYEPSIKLRGSETVRPDFVFYINGDPVLVELLRMSGVKEYNDNWERKRRRYGDCGYVQGKNLICIACNDKSNINSQIIAQTLLNLLHGIIPKKVVYV